MSAPVSTEEEITTGLLAMVAWSGNANAASRALKAEGKLHLTAATLRRWVTELHAARYEELRDKYQDQLEKRLVGDMRELVSEALQVQRIALEKARDRLESGKDEDPGRTAANVARVAQSNTDKMLSLSGRPTQITETRDLGEILRSLAGKGVISLPDTDVVEEAEQLPAGP